MEKQTKKMKTTHNDDDSGEKATKNEGASDSVTGPNYLTTADEILACKDMTPLDRYFTVSALLGRVRPPLDTPPPPHSSLAIARARALAAVEKKKSASQKKLAAAAAAVAGGGEDGGTVMNAAHQKQVEKYRRLIRLRADNEIYTRRAGSSGGGGCGCNSPTTVGGEGGL